MVFVALVRPLTIITHTQMIKLQLRVYFLKLTGKKKDFVRCVLKEKLVLNQGTGIK